MRRHPLQSCLFLALLSLCAANLTIKVPANLPPLPASSRATLTTFGQTFSAPVTVRNTFIFYDIPSGSYDLSIASRDWAFERGLLIRAESSHNANPSKKDSPHSFEVWRPTRGGWDKKRLEGSEDATGAIVDVRLLGARTFYDERQGCKLRSRSLKRENSFVQHVVR